MCLDLVHTAKAGIRIAAISRENMTGKAIDIDGIAISIHNREINDFQQALDGSSLASDLAIGNLILVDLNLPLQCQIASVLDLEPLCQVCAVRLPQDGFALRDLISADKAQTAILNRLFPCFIYDIHLQITSHDLVHRCAGRVGKPCERRPNQHDDAHDQSHNAGQ